MVGGLPISVFSGLLSQALTRVGPAPRRRTARAARTRSLAWRAPGRAPPRGWGPAEQETVVRWDREGECVHLWSASPVTWRKLERLGVPHDPRSPSLRRRRLGPVLHDPAQPVPVGSQASRDPGAKTACCCQGPRLHVGSAILKSRNGAEHGSGAFGAGGGVSSVGGPRRVVTWTTTHGLGVAEGGSPPNPSRGWPPRGDGTPARVGQKFLRVGRIDFRRAPGNPGEVLVDDPPVPAAKDRRLGHLACATRFPWASSGLGQDLRMACGCWEHDVGVSADPSELPAVVRPGRLGETRRNRPSGARGRVGVGSGLPNPRGGLDAKLRRLPRGPATRDPGRQRAEIGRR